MSSYSSSGGSDYSTGLGSYDTAGADKAILLRKHFDQLVTDRKIYEKTWDDLTEYLDPSQGAYIYKQQKYDPQRRSYKRLDSTPIFAIRQLVAKVNAELTGNADRWFEFRDSDPKIDEMYQVRLSLQALSDQAYSMLNTGTFRTAHIEFLLNWVVYGTSCMEMQQDKDDSKPPIFRAVPTREIYIAENEKNEVDLIYRKFTLTYRQACAFFGDENLPEAIHSKGMSNPYDEIEIIHRICPNDEYKHDSKRNKHFKFSSTYISMETNDILREGYFKHNPYIVARFWKRPGEVYGGSCTIDVLPDIRILNMFKEALLRIIQRKSEPPLIMAHDSVVLPIKITPNGINYGGISSDGKRQIGELFEDRDSEQVIVDSIEQQRQIIKSAFFVDPLINRDKSVRTAAEVNQRQDESLLGLTQFLSRLEIEYLYPLLDFALEWVLKNNKNIKIPPELHGHTPAVKFSAPLAKTQRSKELQGWQQLLQMIQPMAQIDPSVLQNFDFNEVVGEIIELLSLPMSAVKDPKVVAAAQAQAQKAQAHQQMLERMQGMAQGASQLASSGLLQRGDLGLPPGQPQPGAGGPPQQGGQ